MLGSVRGSSSNRRSHLDSDMYGQLSRPSITIIQVMVVFMLFSQRIGKKPVEQIIQLDGMNDQLRIGLWNCLYMHHWNVPDDDLNYYRPAAKLMIAIWTEYFKNSLDDLSYRFSNNYPILKKYFFGAKWFEVYDFIEFIINHYDDEQMNYRFTEDCNKVLEREMAGYRLINKRIVSITNHEEISSIESAILESPKPTQEHLKRSLSLLSDRKTQDYRNSIKESISAVESLCKLITGKPKTTLGDALKVIGDKIELHPSLKKGFECIYGYTSDEGGIRHSMLDEPDCSSEDAIFILISCSCFINYLREKANKAGIQGI